MGWDPNKPGMQRVWRRTGRDRDAPRRKSEAYGGLLTCSEQGSAEAEGVLVLMGPAVRVGTRGVGGAELSAPQCVPAEPYPADGLCSEMPLFALWDSQTHLLVPSPTLPAARRLRSITPLPPWKTNPKQTRPGRSDQCRAAAIHRSSKSGPRKV